MALRGVAPEKVLEQVRNTAAWSLDGPIDGPAYAWRRALLDAPSTPHAHDETWRYFSLLLAAHFATVATFVPTDVDRHIRHHAWQSCTDPDRLALGVDAIDAWEHWPVREVSARVVETAAGPLSGHDGELLSVRAGALGRALSLEADAVVERIVAQIDATLARHAAAFDAVADARGRELDALRLAPTIAHNLGDLSRVVTEWPAKSARAAQLRARYGRLGHDDGAVSDARFVRVAELNKQVTAAENHRFLPLRAARPLRLSRALLIGLGPFFDAWGETVARDPLFDDGAAGDLQGGIGAVVTALLEGHAAAPHLQGYLRALAGIHAARPGGLDAVADAVPARLRKLLRGGPVREALGLSADRFAQRMVNRYRQALPAR
ncbi:MAG: hypothetical protein U0325_13970 [Polyangiales bacterium]